MTRVRRRIRPGGCSCKRKGRGKMDSIDYRVARHEGRCAALARCRSARPHRARREGGACRRCRALGPTGMMRSARPGHREIDATGGIRSMGGARWNCRLRCRYSAEKRERRAGMVAQHPTGGGTCAAFSSFTLAVRVLNAGAALLRVLSDLITDRLPLRVPYSPTGRAGVRVLRHPRPVTAQHVTRRRRRPTRQRCVRRRLMALFARRNWPSQSRAVGGELSRPRSDGPPMSSGCARRRNSDLPDLDVPTPAADGQVRGYRRRGLPAKTEWRRWANRNCDVVRPPDRSRPDCVVANWAQGQEDLRPASGLTNEPD